jgi:hypothetical protein
MNTIIHYLHASQIPVVTVASSGVAALMLVQGMTAHSCFKIPLDINKTTQCHLRPGSRVADIIQDARVIIWDKISMQSWHAVEAVDRAIQDLVQNPVPFGGKLVIFVGDFRQTLPLVWGGSIFDQGSECMINSSLWHNVYRFELTENLRLRTIDTDSSRANANFYAWLLTIGSGSNQQDCHERVPLRFRAIVVHSDPDVVQDNAIRSCYPNFDLFANTAEHNTLAKYYTKYLILAPLNSDVSCINKRCYNQFPGPYYISRSIDESIEQDSSLKSDKAVPEEVLNTFTLPGFPLATLKLKVGFPLILLRNLNLKHGLSNGTCLLVRGVSDNVLWCRILTGSCVGTDVLIPKIKLVHKADHVYSVSFSWYQFPVSVAFSLKINKAQGQLLLRVLVYLPQPVFGHGQLYVTLSRAKNIPGLLISIFGDPTADKIPETSNVVNLDVIKMTCSHQ